MSVATVVKVQQRAVIFITGRIGSGKSTVLEQIHEKLRKNWRVSGFVSRSVLREEGKPAPEYHIRCFGSETLLPWAVRNCENRHYDFNESVCNVLTGQYSKDLVSNRNEIFILDELGPLELSGKGFAELFRTALNSKGKALICSVKKQEMNRLIEYFDITSAKVFDLDEESGRRIMKETLRHLEGLDSEAIGIYSALAGGIEVGIGSFVHAYRIPFKGHILAYIQNMLLIFFGKELNGRGLARISFISALLKAFSPVGARLRPMIYIFLQGLFFAIPIMVLGWNIISVVAGSILLGWLTLGIMLGKDYVLFGEAIFDAYVSGARYILDKVGWYQIGFWDLIAFLFIVKAALAVLIAVLVFYFGLPAKMSRMMVQNRKVPIAETSIQPVKRQRLLVIEALRDMLRVRFLIPFILSILLIYFFAGLSGSNLVSVVLRGLIISWFGFLLLRRLNPREAGNWLLRQGFTNLSRSVETALARISQNSVSGMNGRSKE